eukprot:m.29903 g.29903  ORF g.29903 m.29903 type:complete len:289 (-) comp8149_c0_seq1:101-967(-)
MASDEDQELLWRTFFEESGVPASHVNSYSEVFVDNRITMNMLDDLNREILQAMGVAVMGDVIAILKHAKTIVDRDNRMKKEQESKNRRKPVKRAIPDDNAEDEVTNKHARTHTKQNSKKPLASKVRMVAHKKPVQQEDAGPASEEDEESDDHALSDELDEEPSEVQKVTKTHIVKKTNNKRVSPDKIKPKYFKDEDGKIKQARFVPPQHEGAYTVKIPKKKKQNNSQKGNKKNKDILQRLGAPGKNGNKNNRSVSIKKESVHNRLGKQGGKKGNQQADRRVSVLQRLS